VGREFNDVNFDVILTGVVSVVFVIVVVVVIVI
jgi:hypothetical protein